MDLEMKRKEENLMYVPQLHMRSVMGKIGIQTTAGQLDLTQSHAQLSIEQPKAEMNMQTKKPVLHIDQSEAWAEAGIKSTERQIQDQAEEGYRAFLEGIERRAMQGTSLMQIEHEGNPIVQQAEMNAYKELKQIGLTNIPGPFSVQFQYDRGALEINVHPQKPIVHADIKQPTSTFTRGHVDVYMDQYPELHIEVDPVFFERL